MHILITRHGRTNFNDLHLCNADPAIDVHLTAEGIAQAQALAQKLCGRQIDLIITSHLERTQATARYVRELVEAPMAVDARIGDRRTGFESRPVAEFFEFIKDDPYHICPPGGESFQDEKARVRSFLLDLLGRGHETVLIVTHYEIGVVMLGLIEDLRDEQFCEKEFENCELIELIVDRQALSARLLQLV